MPLLWYLTIRDLLAGTLSQQLGIYYVVGFLVCVALVYTMDNIEKYSINVKAFPVFAEERIKLGDHIKKLPMGFFNKKSAGELSNTLTESVQSIEYVPPIVLLFKNYANREDYAAAKAKRGKSLLRQWIAADMRRVPRAVTR